MAITKLVLNGTEYEIGNLVNTTGPMLYDGIELEDYTWADIQTMCDNGDFENLREGDYKTIKLTAGETVVMQIAGIDTYYKTTDVSLGHHIDWISKDCLSTTQQWNTSNNNNGNGDTTSAYPYMVSNIYTVLNSTIYPTLPSDVRAVIFNKKTLMEQRYSSSSPLTDSTTWGWQDIGQIWLPSEYEVFGAQVWGTKGYGVTQAVQYPLFANSFYHRIKGQGDGGPRCTWWLSTVRSGTSTYCCHVSNNGNAGGSTASTSLGVPVCFRIAAS